MVSEKQHEPQEKASDGRWERRLLEKMALASVVEARRSRRWGIFFKGLTFLYLFALLALLIPQKFPQSVQTLGGEHTAVVDVKGIIAPQTKASADDIVEGLRNAFEDERTKGVVLRINSPGGSPVQAGYVNDEIQRLKKKYPEIPVYAVVADVCASGGYYIAAAADEIYADKASIVGSIGVLMNSFGFTDTLEMLGVERRLLTAGDRKGMLDPFSEFSEQDRAYLQGVLDQLHTQFIAAVKAGRGDRLRDDPDLFSGLFWSGEESVELGLVDGLGSSGYVARELIGAEQIKDFTPKKELWESLAERLGSGVAQTLLQVWGVGNTPL